MTLDVFRTPPAPLSPLQRRLVWIAAIVVAATRLLAVSATLWDWDEALFVFAVRDYDVTHHHPHPPGFPVYLAMANFASLFTSSELRALQAVVVLSAIALFPLAFLLGHELRLGFRTSYLGALLFVFFPNVWYYGGTALSDVASVALILAACVLLLRGCRDTRAYFAGAIALALAAGVRSQSLLIGMAPALLASWMQLRRVIPAALLSAATLVACYGGAALASASVDGYLRATRWHAEYVRDIDGIGNPGRTPLAELAAAVFVRPMRGGRLPVVVLVLALVGVIASIVRKQVGVWLMIATFAPFAVFAWLMLDPSNMPRFAVAWLFLYASLAAYGVAFLTEVTRVGTKAEIALMAAITLRFAWWTWPAVDDARSSPSPPVAAFAWAAKQSGTIYYDGSLMPHGEALLPNKRRVKLDNAAQLPVAPKSGDVWVIENVTDSLDSRAFRHAHSRLWQIVRGRYLVVSATPAASVPLLGDGWWDAEFDDMKRWRWMRRRSVSMLAAVGPRARLTLRAGCPTENQIVDVAINDRRAGSFRCGKAATMHTWTVAARADARNELVISTNRGIHAEGDPRELGVRVEGIGWRAVAP